MYFITPFPVLISKTNRAQAAYLSLQPTRTYFSSQFSVGSKSTFYQVALRFIQTEEVYASPSIPILQITIGPSPAMMQFSLLVFLCAKLFECYTSQRLTHFTSIYISQRNGYFFYATMVISSTAEKFHSNFPVSSMTGLKDDFIYLF